MQEKSTGCLSLLFLIFIGWLIHSHYENKIEESYSTGYDDGHDDGLAEISREDVVLEEVNGDPKRYCDTYATAAVEEYHQYLQQRLICRER